jgi:hypothetical protein
MNQFEKIQELIKRDKLSSKDRTHELVYRRAFLMHELRSSGMTLKDIGSMFKRDHATVLHSLRTHEWMTNTKDKLYAECIAEYQFLLDHVDRESARDLYTDILKCQSYATLKIIKSRIKRGVYAEKVVSC